MTQLTTSTSRRSKGKFKREKSKRLRHWKIPKIPKNDHLKKLHQSSHLPPTFAVVLPLHPIKVWIILLTPKHHQTAMTCRIRGFMKTKMKILSSQRMKRDQGTIISLRQFYHGNMP
ncbi:hypothetical protein C1646_344599 [Rhizophagus diaphanus]|nr:hypothetical protein C1646_344599 [Rhizophagus diaphanus] [Rhizophagus sp. MUCL 43196]